MHRRAPCRRSFRALDFPRQTFRQTIAPADHRETHIIAHQIFSFGIEIIAQKRHQRRDFRLRPTPIVGGERVARQRRDTLIWRGANDASQRFDACLVSFQTRQSPLRRPAPIAVHDDRDVKFAIESTWHCKVSFQKNVSWAARAVLRCRNLRPRSWQRPEPAAQAARDNPRSGGVRYGSAGKRFADDCLRSFW